MLLSGYVNTPVTIYAEFHIFRVICLPAPQVTLFAMCLIHLDAVSRYRIDELRSSDGIMLTPCDGSYLTVGLVQCV